SPVNGSGSSVSRQNKIGLRFTLFRDIERSPRKVWLINDLLGAGELSCTYGAPGSGKSVLASDRAAHVAAGRPWVGRRVIKGAVLYIAVERAALVMRRLAAWRIRYGIDDLPLAVLSGSIDLRSSRADADRIVKATKRLVRETGYEPRLIEIDTVSRVL